MARHWALGVEEVDAEGDCVCLAECLVYSSCELAGVGWEVCLQKVVDAALERIVNGRARGVSGGLSEC